MTILDPKSYYHARKDPRWQVAMDEEMNSLQKNTTWELVSLPLGRKLVQCKSAFQNKVETAERTYKYKAILVAKFFFHVQGVDYHETFALVAKMESIRLVLAISASKHWEVHHMDVKLAFLNGYIHEEIYMNHPKGYITDPSLVFKLKKSLYGLKQAPREGYSKMDTFLLSKNF